jgi:pimeloyl-ACP methyl ester carboxylesterase
MSDFVQDTLAGSDIYLRRGVNLQVCHSQGSTPTFVFLHGGTGNRFNLRSQYEFAQSQGWGVLAYDLAGHGQSSSYYRYSIDRHRRDLKRLLQRFNIEAPILCCHSYGVPIGLEFAQHYSVRGIIAIAGGAHNITPWWEIPLMKFMAWGGRYIFKLPATQSLSNRLSSSYKHTIITTFFRECPVPTDFQTYKALEIFWDYNFYSRNPVSKITNIPILVISGGKDPTFTVEMGDELAGMFNHRTHLHLKDAGHLVYCLYS